MTQYREVAGICPFTNDGCIIACTDGTLFRFDTLHDYHELRSVPGSQREAERTDDKDNAPVP
jgi:hypothetical protein